MIAVSKSFISTFLLAPHLVSGVKLAQDNVSKPVSSLSLDSGADGMGANPSESRSHGYGEFFDSPRSPHLEGALDADLVRSSSGDIQVHLQTENGGMDVFVNPEANIYECVAKELESSHQIVIERVAFGGDEVSKEQSFSELGIENEARLSVETRKRFSFQKVVEDMLELNPHLCEDDLTKGVQVDPENHSRVLGKLLWHEKDIVALPESIGDLEIRGHFALSRNQLQTLPESFGNLTVGGNLCLEYNRLTSLPGSFGRLIVGGDLWLGNNKPTVLPDSIGNLQVGGGLFLSNNHLTGLPDSIGNISIGSNLVLTAMRHDNLGQHNLITIPASFKANFEEELEPCGGSWRRRRPTFEHFPRRKRRAAQRRYRQTAEYQQDKKERLDKRRWEEQRALELMNPIPEVPVQRRRDLFFSSDSSSS